MVDALPHGRATAGIEPMVSHSCLFRFSLLKQVFTVTIRFKIDVPCPISYRHNFDAKRAYEVAREHAPADDEMGALPERQIARLGAEPVGLVSPLRNPWLE